MNNNQIKRFVMFYERLTTNMARNFRKNDVVFFIDDSHKIKSINFK